MDIKIVVSPACLSFIAVSQTPIVFFPLETLESSYIPGHFFFVVQIAYCILSCFNNIFFQLLLLY